MFLVVQMVFYIYINNMYSKVIYELHGPLSWSILRKRQFFDWKDTKQKRNHRSNKTFGSNNYSNWPPELAEFNESALSIRDDGKKQIDLNHPKTHHIYFIYPFLPIYKTLIICDMYQGCSRP